MGSAGGWEVRHGARDLERKKNRTKKDSDRDKKKKKTSSMRTKKTSSVRKKKERQNWRPIRQKSILSVQTSSV
jgi:hypothetical protein